MRTPRKVFLVVALGAIGVGFVEALGDFIRFGPNHKVGWVGTMIGAAFEIGLFAMCGICRGRSRCVGSSVAGDEATVVGRRVILLAPTDRWAGRLQFSP